MSHYLIPERVAKLSKRSFRLRTKIGFLTVVENIFKFEEGSTGKGTTSYLVDFSFEKHLVKNCDKECINTNCDIFETGKSLRRTSSIQNRFYTGDVEPIR